MKKEDLKKILDSKRIWYPKGATIDVMKRFLVRAYLNETKLQTKNCFGLWDREDQNCKFCKFEKDCFETGLGLKFETYMNFYNKSFEQQSNLKPKVSKKRLQKAIEVADSPPSV